VHRQPRRCDAGHVLAALGRAALRNSRQTSGARSDRRVP
jgi:hypothetical protein